MYCGSIWVNKSVRGVRVGVVYSNPARARVTARVWGVMGYR